MLFVNENYFKAKNNSSAIQVFPLEESSISVSASNLYRDGVKLYLDLEVSNLEGFFDLVKVTSLSESDLVSLQRTGFPTQLQAETKKRLFSATSGGAVFDAKNSISNVQIDLKQIPGQNFKILVSIINSSLEIGQVFLLSISRQDIVNKSGLPEVSVGSLQTFNQSDSTTILQAIRDNAYTSDLLYSFSNNRVLTGFYALDAQKLINERTKFPNLIQVDDNDQFEQFLASSKIQFTTYDSAKFGYEFEDVFAVVNSQRIDGLQVGDAINYKFYNFSILNINPYANYEVKIILYFNDITINIAQQLLLELKETQRINDRQGAINIISLLFDDNIPLEYRSEFNKYEIISQADFDDFVNKVISLFAEKIESATERVVANEHVASQYTTPYFSLFNSYANYFEQSFDKKIKINSDKDNTFFNLENTAFFKSVPSDSINLEDRKYINALVKSFDKIKNIRAIPSFSITSIKGDKVNQGGLVNEVDCGDADQRAKEKIGLEQPQLSLSLTTIEERGIKLFYLENIGSTVSALNFRELNETTLSLLQPGQRLLARLDNYEEFYDSYFYIEGTSVQ